MRDFVYAGYPDQAIQREGAILVTKKLIDTTLILSKSHGHLLRLDSVHRFCLEKRQSIIFFYEYNKVDEIINLK